MTLLPKINVCLRGKSTGKAKGVPYVRNKQRHALMDFRPAYFLICNYLVISRAPGESWGKVKDAGSLVQSGPSERVFGKELINQMAVSGSGSGGDRRGSRGSGSGE